LLAARAAADAAASLAEIESDRVGPGDPAEDELSLLAEEHLGNRD
jgi:hypothetical protein